MFANIKFKRFIPFLVLVALAIVAGGTDVFSETIRLQFIDVFKSKILSMKPMLGNIYLGLVILSLMYCLASPIKLGVQKALNLTGADDRGRLIVTRAVNLLYWVAAVLIGVSFIAPNFLSSVFLGFGIFTAAITISLKDLIVDLLSGLMLSFSPKFKIGDYVEIIGLPVKGVVKDVGYVLTVIELPDTEEEDQITVPNRELWNRAVKSLPANQRPSV